MTNVNTPVHTKHEMNMYTQVNMNDKVIKLPSKRLPESNSNSRESPLHEYYDTKNLYKLQQSHKIAQRTTARINFQFPRVAAPRIIMTHVYRIA